MTEVQARLLIIEDDIDIAEMLNAYFRMQEYQVSVENWGIEGVKACLEQQPDLVILDIRLPDIDGFEVARRLQSNRKTHDIPIIFLTEKRERSDRLIGLSLKADDYITKPFDIQELRLRVGNVLTRRRRTTMTNPVTGLPEGSLVDDRLKDYLEMPGFSISVISLKHLGRFREVYGFVASDDLLRAVTLLMQDVLHRQNCPNIFIGHLDQTNFLLLIPSTSADSIKDLIRKRLGQSLDYFYRDQDRESELFRDHRLLLEIHDFTPVSTQFPDVNSLRAALERLYR